MIRINLIKPVRPKFIVEYFLTKKDKNGEGAYWRIKSGSNTLVTSEKYKNVNAGRRIAKKLAVNLKGSIYRELDKR